MHASTEGDFAGRGSQSHQAIWPDVRRLTQQPTGTDLRAHGDVSPRCRIAAPSILANMEWRRITRTAIAQSSSELSQNRNDRASEAVFLTRQIEISLGRSFASARNMGYISVTTKSREQPSPTRARMSSRALVLGASHAAGHYFPGHRVFVPVAAASSRKPIWQNRISRENQISCLTMTYPSVHNMVGRGAQVSKSAGHVPRASRGITGRDGHVCSPCLGAMW